MTDTQSAIVSQYHAALAMLDGAVDACTDAVWNDARHENPFWHIAYHTLFYTHLYLSASEAEFDPWAKTREDYCFMGPYPWPPHDVPKIGEPYSIAEIREYAAIVNALVAPRVKALALDEPSGFPWIPLTRLELHLYNIRHVQHHTGQLIDRVRRDAGASVGWVGTTPTEQ